MVGQFGQCCMQCGGRDIVHVVQDIVILHDAQVFQCHSRADRVTRIGVTVVELDRIDHLCDLVTDNRPSNWHIARAETFGDCHDVGFDSHCGRAEPIAGTAKTADDLICDDQHIIFVANPLNFRPVGAGRYDYTAGTLDRLTDERCYFFRPQFQNFRFQLLRAREAEFFRRHVTAFGPPVGLADMVDTGNRQTALRVHVGHPAQTAGADG